MKQQNEQFIKKGDIMSLKTQFEVLRSKILLYFIREPKDIKVARQSNYFKLTLEEWLIIEDYIKELKIKKDINERGVLSGENIPL